MLIPCFIRGVAIFVIWKVLVYKLQSVKSISLNLFWNKCLFFLHFQLKSEATRAFEEYDACPSVKNVRIIIYI
jgi:hypothetical protein